MSYLKPQHRGLGAMSIAESMARLVENAQSVVNRAVDASVAEQHAIATGQAPPSLADPTYSIQVGDEATQTIRPTSPAPSLPGPLQDVATRLGPRGPEIVKIGALVIGAMLIGRMIQGAR